MFGVIIIVTDLNCTLNSKVDLAVWIWPQSCLVIPCLCQDSVGHWPMFTAGSRLLLAAMLSSVLECSIDVSDYLKWRLVVTKGGKLRWVIKHIIWTNKKTESSVYCWQHALAMFDVTCFPTFVRASDVISSVMSIRYFSPHSQTFTNTELECTSKHTYDPLSTLGLGAKLL